MINRRKALAAMTGSVVAAPSTAKAILNDDASKYIGNATQQGSIEKDYAGAIKEKAASHEQWLIDRKAKLQKIVNGEFDYGQLFELEHMDYNSRRRTEMEICNLKSVSEGYKLEMINELSIKRRKKEFKRTAARELKELLSSPIKRFF